MTAPTGTSSCASARSASAIAQAHRRLVARPVAGLSQTLQLRVFSTSADMFYDPVTDLSHRRPAAPSPLVTPARVLPTAESARYRPGEIVVRYDGRHERGSCKLAPGRQRRHRRARVARPARCAERHGELRRAPRGLGARRPRRGGRRVRLAADAVELPARDRRRRARRVGAPAGRGRPGGQGVTVAVLDTGVAYADRDRFRRSPDFAPHRFVRGWDFVGDDPYPHDDNGHGTHVASTIAEGTGNGIGLTGLAYGARVMPVKVLDRAGEGDSERIASGIRWAADHGAKIINLSFEFPSDIGAPADPEHPRRDPPRPPQGRARGRRVRQRGRLRGRLPGALERRAVRRRDDPARLPGRLLQRGPGPRHRRPRRRRGRGAGGRPRLPPRGTAGARHLPGDVRGRPCAASASPAATSAPRWPRRTPPPPRRWSSPRACSAANPSPAAIERRLELTARDLGPPGKDPHYGWGRLDAARATDPAIPVT